MKTFFAFLILIASVTVSTSIQAQTSSSEAKDALVVTWQNKGGYWFAIGPTQIIEVGCKTENEAIGLVGGGKKEDLTFKETVDKYRIYSLKRPLKSYDVDARKFLKGKGITLEY